MPELPEVETVRTGLEKAVKGAKIEHVALFRKDLRTPFPKDFAKRLKGKTITRVTRRAKYLLLHLDNGEAVLAHLGMSGRILVRAQGAHEKQKHDHVLMLLSNGKELVMNDARRFGLMLLLGKGEEATHPLLSHLGPEPLEKAFSPTYLKTELLRKKGPIKPVLMDQRLVVGVGNIYASEALFRCKIHPDTPAFLCATKAGELIDSIRTVLKAAIASGGSTLRNYASSSGDVGYFQHHFNVYGRAGKPCFSCKSAIEQSVHAGRSTFFCPGCQKAKNKSLNNKKKK